MENYNIPIRQTDWQVQSVYTVRDKNWKPSSCILSLTTPWYKYLKRLSLPFHQLQTLLGCQIDCDDPERSVQNQWLRISETVVAIDDNDVVI